MKVLLMLFGSLACWAAPTAAQRQAGLFVREFYAWYAPLAKGEGRPALEQVFRQRRSDFSHELLKALGEGAKDSREGLPFDPFLGPVPALGIPVVGKVLRKGEAHCVGLHASPAGLKEGKPAQVVAEVREKEGRWYFVNVHYPGKHDLLAILAALKVKRGRHLPTLAGQGLGAGGWPAIVQARRMSWAVC